MILEEKRVIITYRYLLGKKIPIVHLQCVMFSYSHSMHKSLLFSGNQGTSSVSLWSMCLGFLLLPSIFLSKSEVPKLFLLDSHTWNLMEGHGQKANSYCIVNMQNGNRIPSSLNCLTSCAKCHSTFHAQIMKNNLIIFLVYLRKISFIKRLKKAQTVINNVLGFF